MENKKLFLIDGHSLIFRMYYAFLRHPMINSKGTDVSILFGFTKYLLELMEKEQPSHMAVCFDPPGKTFRHQMYPEYKGTRSATPELVIEALDPLTEICKALGLPVLMIPGFEGDDVLGAMAVRSAAEGFDVYMVTPDKDFGQLVSDRIRQFKPGKAGGENEILGPKELCEKLGIDSPCQVIEMLTLCGDSADNVPGVNGVGEVGAGKLIRKYGTVENIYAHLDELSPRQQQMFRDAQDHIALSKQLVTIKTDIDLSGVTADDMLLRSTHSPRAMELFNHYEFTSLKKYIHLADGVKVEEQSPGRKLEWKQCDVKSFCNAAKKSGACAVMTDIEGEGVFAKIDGICAATSSEGGILVCRAGAQELQDILEDGAVSKCGYNLKLLHSLLFNAGIKLNGCLNDIELMHYLVNPEKSHKLDILARSYLNIIMEEEQKEEEPAPMLGLFDAVDDAPLAAKDHSKEVAAILLLADELRAELRRLDMEKLFLEVEEPLQRVLAKMERDGVKVDLVPLRSFANELAVQAREIEARVREMAGEPDLNVASPKQVGTMLYEKLRIDPKVKAKKDARNSYPTDEETLSNYAESFPIINEILDYRAVKKLLGTYIEPFGTWIAPQDGRIHTTFNQALTATGRLSSARPNLQNIPIRTDRGKEIRKAFVASSPDKVIVSADYSQIELRLMAHFCGDLHMQEAFRAGQDVHAMTAAKIFDTTLEEVTDHMRRTAKTANFGIMYGISAFGLAQRLRIPRVAAKKIIEDYFAGFPSIQQWIEKTKADAAACGYVQTLFGRRRYLPDINSRNVNVRGLAERNAINAPIQGTAADIIKIAMIRVAARLEELGMESKMVLQIHDELVFEAPRTELEQLMGVIRQEMENVLELSVPLTVEANYGDNWLEAH
ncbi:MAG: DNA polymerase I [Bacteroidales bacterium]|nr:DNA polymerase I [Bacteroidales bacterium]